MTGSAGQKRVPAKFLENYLISIPPIDEQQKFAKSKIQCDKSKVTAGSFAECAANNLLNSSYRHYIS